MNEKDLKTTDFYEKVYQLVRQIPYGKVSTYGLIASFLGSPQAARMVGYAMNLSHYSQTYVPAHRVVNRNGVLTGKHHFFGENTMRDLLLNEGIPVINDTIQNFNSYLWNPNKELRE
jgi:methylated-DNA-protein-cysteine methyltransferase related protein